MKINVTFIPQKDKFVVVTPSFYDDGATHLTWAPF